MKSITAVIIDRLANGIFSCSLSRVVGFLCVHFTRTVVFILAILYCCNAVSAQERTFRGNLDKYLKEAKKRLDSFYSQTIDCAISDDEQAEYIENISEHFLTNNAVLIPDFGVVNNDAQQFSYGHYVNCLYDLYRTILMSGSISFSQNDFKVNKACWLDDDKGLMIILNYTNKVLSDQDELCVVSSQAVIIFPDVSKFLNCKIQQISLLQCYRTYNPKPRVRRFNLGNNQIYTKVEKILEEDNPDWSKARILIKEAFKNPTMEILAKTWYTAGLIENKQFLAENNKRLLGDQFSEPYMYQALYNLLPYFKKAYDLDKQSGGLDKESVKNIKKVLSYSHPYYYNGGVYFYNKNNYKQAFELFNQYLEISELPMFIGTSTAAKDSLYMYTLFYSAITATQLGDHKMAIQTLTRAKHAARQNEIYQNLAKQYSLNGNLDNFEKILLKAREQFPNEYPNEQYYILELAQMYIDKGKPDESARLLRTAINKDPKNPYLYYVLGHVYEVGFKDYGKAENYYSKAISLSPDDYVFLYALGRIYYDQGRDIMQQNGDKVKKEMFFRKALPVFERAYVLIPDSKDLIEALKEIYSYLRMNDKLNAIETKKYFEKIMQEAREQFPNETNEQYYILKLTQMYIDKGKPDESARLLSTAINKDPKNPYLYYVLGHVYEVGFKDYGKAENYYSKAISLSPDDYVFLYALGRIYYDQGRDIMQQNGDKVKKEMFFRKALPVFERAYVLIPDSKDLIKALKDIYSYLRMNDKLNAIETKRY